MTYEEYAALNSGEHWIWRVEAERQNGEVIHEGEHGYIRRVGKYLGMALYQVCRAVAIDRVVDGEIVRGKDAALALVS